MRTWIVEFYRKYENRGIKINLVNSIVITSINLQVFTLILYCVGVRNDVDMFKAIFRAQSIYREVDYRCN